MYPYSTSSYGTVSIFGDRLRRSSHSQYGVESRTSTFTELSELTLFINVKFEIYDTDIYVQKLIFFLVIKRFLLFFYKWTSLIN